MQRISIITPCRNAGRYLKSTIQSVLEQTVVQTNKVELQYLICDGGSTDNTLDIIQEFDHPSIEVISEQDRGMYEALSNGLQRVSGDIISYLNAGDLFHSRAFEVVLEVMEDSKILWLTGMSVYLNQRGAVTSLHLPFRFRRKYIRAGIYGTSLPFIQQEGTFWKNSLNSTIDHQKLQKLRYAGDYFLWFTFAANHRLYIVESFLGGFQIHPGQISEQRDKYRDEMKRFCRINFFMWLISWFDWPFWYLPTRLKKVFNPTLLRRYNHLESQWK